MSDLVERVTQMLIQDFQHCDCDTGQCTSYEFRTKGKCACRDGAMRAIAIVLEEAARCAEGFPARTHGALATAPYAAAEQAAEEIAAAIRALANPRS